MPKYYVDHVGHPYAMMAVGFQSLDKAMAEARRSCKDVMETRVWGDSNNLICKMDNQGRRYEVAKGTSLEVGYNA